MSSAPNNILPLRVRPVSQLVRRPVRWLWPGRLALGKLSMLEGDPDLGKSLVALDLCARLSTGRPLPDDSPGPGVASAIVLNGEDGAEDTIAERLGVLGADLDRVLVEDRDGRDWGELVRFPTHTGALDQVLAQTGARLVVIDPVTAFLDPGIQCHSDQSVRRALDPLGQLAQRRGCAVLLVRHLNKSGDRRSLYRGAGSIGFLAACRSGWLIARDPQEAERCVLAQVKNNLAPRQPSLAYEKAAGEDALPRLTWLGQSPWGADQLLAGRAVAPSAPALVRARDFLEDLLEGGAQTTRAIWEAAREVGLSERTLDRARHELGARSVRVWVEKRSVQFWLLPGQRLPEGVPPGEAPADLEEWLAPLRAQFPPCTPLDEL